VISDLTADGVTFIVSGTDADGVDGFWTLAISCADGAAPVLRISRLGERPFGAPTATTALRPSRTTAQLLADVLRGHWTPATIAAATLEPGHED